MRIRFDRRSPFRSSLMALLKGKLRKPARSRGRSCSTEVLEDKTLLSGHGLHLNGHTDEIDWGQFQADADYLIEQELGSDSTASAAIANVVADSPDHEAVHTVIDAHLSFHPQLAERIDTLLHAYELSIDAHSHGAYAPGTPREYMDEHPDAFHAGDGDFEPFRTGPRWSTTATDGGGLVQGDATTLTWSIIEDGGLTDGNPTEQSDLVDFLEGIYGSDSPTDGDFTNEPWFDEFENMFDRWSDVSGITYVYEPNDDGVAFHAPGILGVRGDVRIGGHRIDGPSGVLAYNYFPNSGDMIIDTDDTFYNNTGGNSIRLRNVLAHEAGHGFGLSHVESNNARFLMEPFINTSFDGGQFDDILGVHRHYGDFNETADNDIVTQATDLGDLEIGTPIEIGTDADDTVVVGNNNDPDAGDVDFVSIDDNSDVDFYQFTVASSGILDVTLIPHGPTYNEGPQNGSQSPFDTSALSDLAFELFDTDGTTSLAAVDNEDAGENEVLEIGLDEGGTYFISITGADNAAQFYELNLEFTEPTDFGDAPESYGTLLEDDGARHLATGLTLGALRDDEVDGSPSSGADGDGADEDGITFAGAIVPGYTTDVSVIVDGLAFSEQGLLDAWADWNGNGVFDANEKAFDGVPVVDGNNLFMLDVPADAYGIGGDAYGRGSTFQTYARFRLSTDGISTPDGLAPDGEVEDYLLTITPPNIGYEYTAASYSTPEGDDTHFDNTVVVSRGGETDANSTVDVVLTGNTATEGSDFTAGPIAVNFDAGETTAVVPIEILGDIIVEGDEIIDLSLSFPVTGGSAGAQATSELILLNEDTAGVALDDGFSLAEGDSGTVDFEFDVTLDQEVQDGFSIEFSVTGITATEGSDYEVITDSPITFAGTANETHTIVVRVNGELVVEGDEVFRVELGEVSDVGPNFDPNDIEPDSEASDGTILNDDTASVSLVGDVSVAEGTGGSTNNLIFDVMLDNPVQGGFSLDYVTNDDTATLADNDYADNDGTLGFAGGAGEIETITVAVNHDSKVEADELLDIVLGAISNLAAGIDPADVTVGTDTATGTIENDDTATLTIIPVTPSADEGTALVFDIVLSADVDGGLTLDYTTDDDTATAADADYTDSDGTFTYAGTANETMTVTVPTGDDTKVEGDELLDLVLGAVSGLAAGIDPGDITTGGPESGTIVNEDTTTVTVTQLGLPPVDEGTSGSPTSIDFEITLGNAVQGGFDLDIETADGTATAADDYTDADTTLGFTGSENETSSVTVDVTADSKVEADELFRFLLSGISLFDTGIDPADVTLAGPLDVDIINDDTTSVTLTAVDTVKDEGTGGTDTPFTFEVTISNAVQGGLDVNFVTNDGSATVADADYTDNDSSVSLAGTAGETAGVTVDVLHDAKVELDELFSVVLTSVSGLASGVDSADVIVDTTAVDATIRNDDAPGFVVSETGGDTVVVESGTTDTIEVVLSAQPAEDVILNVVSGDTGEATVSPASLTFTSANWATPQVVTVTGVDDSIEDGDVDSLITVSVDPASFDPFDGEADQTVTVTTIDDELVRILNDSGSHFSLTGSWQGGDGGYLDDIHYGGSTNPGPATRTASWTTTISPGVYLISATWAPPNGNQQAANPFAKYTVSDGSDALETVELNQRLTPDDRTDEDTPFEDLGLFAFSETTLTVQLSNIGVGFTVADAIRIERIVDPGVKLQESSGTTEVSEDGVTDSYELTLNTIPTDDVVITVTPDAQLDLGAGPGTAVQLTFTAANAFTPQTITVAADDDTAIEGLHNGLIVHSVSSADSGYDGAPVPDVNVEITDNDSPPSFIVDNDDPEYSTTGNWQGGTGGHNDSIEYGSSVRTGPATRTASWTVSVTPGQYRVSATWAPPNGNANAANRFAQYRVFDDTTDVGGATFNQRLAPDDRTDSGTDFEDIGIFRVDSETLIVQLSNTGTGFTVADAVRIEPVIFPRITISESDGSTNVVEGGATDSYTVVLDSVPTAAVTVTVTPDAQTDLGAGPGTAIDLVFTPGNALTPQTVDVMAVDDSDVEGSHTSTITHSAASADSDYDGIGVDDVIANITDNDSSPGTIIDNTDAEFSTSGNWQGDAAGHLGNQIYGGSTRTGPITRTAVWSTNVTPGDYRIHVTWAAPAGNLQAANQRADFQVFDDATSRGTVQLNQRILPDDLLDQGTLFEELGVFSISSGTLTVELGNLGTGFTVADAIRFELVTE